MFRLLSGFFISLCDELNKKTHAVFIALADRIYYSAHLASILSKRFATFDTVCFALRSGAICRYF